MVGLVLTVLLGMMPVLSLAAPGPSRLTQQGTNLLANPGFETDWGVEASNRVLILSDEQGVYETVKGNIFTPPGWMTWFRHKPRDDSAKGWDQPEVTDTVQNPDPRRTRTGTRAMRMFTFYRRHDGGFYQTVGGLQPGQTVQFSAYGEAWSCNEDNQDATSCGDPWAIVFKVGIDPTGGTNPFAGSVVWSGDQKSPDAYGLIGPVTAQVGPAGAVTVFLRSTAKYPYKHMDAYWDDASLVVAAPAEPPTSTPPPAPPTATPGPSPTPLPTATPRPDGATVHTVQSGDTLFGIALRYGVSADQIRELNADSIGPNNLIQVGQELVISIPSGAPTSTPLPEPPTATPEAAETESESEAETAPSPEADGASICVLAFHDRNGDTVRDSEGEELLPNVEFTVANASGIVGEYTTDGVSEPYCFTGLASGPYRVIQQAPAGYAPTGLPEQNVALATGTSFDFQFGNTRTGGVASSEETEEGGTENQPNKRGLFPQQYPRQRGPGGGRSRADPGGSYRGPLLSHSTPPVLSVKPSGCTQTRRQTEG
jgi:LysM repeat protein